MTTRRLSARISRAGSLVLLLLLAASCARLSVEHEVKPIHIVADINLRIDRQLDEFFAYEQKYQPPPATQPATTQPVAVASPIQRNQ